jgi:hypothetical protein
MVTMQEIIRLLEDARKAATLKTAAFGQIYPENPNYPTSEKEVTPFIQERVRIHHESWIIGPIDEAIEALKENYARNAR